MVRYAVSLEIVGRKCRQLTPPFPVLVLHPPRPSPTHLLCLNSLPPRCPDRDPGRVFVFSLPIHDSQGGKDGRRSAAPSPQTTDFILAA